MTNPTSPAGATGRNASDPRQIPWRGWWQVARRAFTEASRDNLDLLAAGVAFYAFLAFVPLLASIVLIYGLVANAESVASHLLVLVRNLPADIAGIIGDQLVAITSEAPTRQGVGLLTATALSIYGATKGAKAIIGALNVTYEEEERRGFIKLTLLALGMTLGAVAVGIAVTAAIAAMSLLGNVIPAAAPLPLVGTIVAWSVAALILAALIAAIYRYGPDRDNARWSWLSPGAVLASIGIFVGTLAFGFYVSRFGSYNATYGALGAVVSFLMWLYLSAYILLFGAEFNAELERQTARDTTEGAERPMGARGAAMADTVAAPDGSPAPDNTRGEPAPLDPDRG